MLKTKQTTEQISVGDKTMNNCQCIKCGYKLVSEKHCNTIKCPKCGGSMRRAERPGPGREKRDERGRLIVAENVPIVIGATIFQK